MVVGAGLDGYTINDFEWFLDSVPGEIEPGMNLIGAFPFPVYVGMQKPGFLKTAKHQFITLRITHHSFLLNYH